MSNATEADLQSHLDQMKVELGEAVARGREANLAAMSARGMVHSSNAILNGVASLDASLNAHFAAAMPLVDRWTGPSLTQDRARQLITAHLQSAIETFVRPEFAYRMGTRASTSDSVQRAFQSRLDAVKARLGASVRAFELGADKDPDHIRSLLQTLVEQIEAQSPELAKMVSPDTDTINSQLKKAEPSLPIMREAAQSVRSVVEGAAGGAIGNALSPGLARTFEQIFKALGLG